MLISFNCFFNLKNEPKVINVVRTYIYFAERTFETFGLKGY
jgi:hypothetical protein